MVCGGEQEDTGQVLMRCGEKGECGMADLELGRGMDGGGLDFGFVEAVALDEVCRLDMMDVELVVVDALASVGRLSPGWDG